MWFRRKLDTKRPLMAIVVRWSAMRWACVEGVGGGSGRVGVDHWSVASARVRFLASSRCGSAGGGAGRGAARVSASPLKTGKRCARDRFL